MKYAYSTDKCVTVVKWTFTQPISVPHTAGYNADRLTRYKNHLLGIFVNFLKNYRLPVVC